MACNIYTNDNSPENLIPGYHSDDMLEYNEPSPPATAPTKPVDRDLGPCYPLRSDSPLPAHHPYPLTLPTLHSPEYSESSTEPRLHSSMDSNYAFFTSHSSLEYARKLSAVGSIAPTPTLLTKDLMDVGDNALACYEVVRMKYFEAPPEV